MIYGIPQLIKQEKLRTSLPITLIKKEIIRMNKLSVSCEDTIETLQSKFVLTNDEALQLIIDVISKKKKR